MDVWFLIARSTMVVYVHKDRIVPGEIILCHDGLWHTVCRKDIKYSYFMGVTIWGDSYHLGHKLVPTILLDTFKKE